MAHEYLITRPHGVPLDVPTMRDPSLLVYFRGESGGLVMGGYERHPAPWGLDGIPPDFNGKLLAEDWERFEELMTNALVRVPELGEAEVIRLVNGPEAFTPDGEFILGPTEVRGFWVAAGFCAHGLAGAGGMGKLVAEWIVDGLPGFDVWEMDSRRFGAHYASRDYTLARTIEIYSTYYDVKYPGHEREAGRPLRLSPAYPRLVELGAAFGEKSGWERANWFEPNAAAGDESLRPRGWAGRLWSPAIGAEHRACRESAALFDETSFAKIDVSGEGAAAFLERVCDNRVAREVGQITYTSMLNARGGIECDFTVTRLAEDRFRIVTGTAFGRHDLAWIRQHAPEDGSVLVEDVTSKLACLGLWGPAAREILQATTTDELAFGYMRARELAVGPVPCLALRVTYVGELGWELYCPTEFGLALWDTLWEAGRAPRARRRRLQGDRLAAPGEGLPGLGRRHHPGRHALRGRARLRGQARQGRLHRARGAARGAGAGAQARLPRALGSPLGRARVGAGARRRRARRPRDERRLRLHGRALDRLRLRPGRARRARASRSRSRSSASGSRARSPPSRSSIPPESGSGAERSLRAGRSRRRARRPRRTPARSAPAPSSSPWRIGPLNHFLAEITYQPPKRRNAAPTMIGV